MRDFSPILSGWQCRCPECGEGEIFQTYLGFRTECGTCQADFSIADAGDGPAFFVMFVVGMIIVPLSLIFEIMFTLPMWLHMAVWIPAIIVLSILLLRPFKGVLFAIQWKTKAHGASYDGD